MAFQILNSKAYPTLSEFRQYCRSADEDNTITRDNRSLLYSINRILQYNPRIFGHYLTRATALSSFEWDLIPKENAKIDDKTMHRISRLTDSLLSTQIKSIFFGASLWGLSPETTESGTMLGITKYFNPWDFDFDTENIYLYDSNGNKNIAAGINETSLYLLDSVDYYPVSGGLGRTIMPLEILRFDALLELGNYLRKLKGILQIVNKGGSGEDQSAAEEAAKLAVMNNYVTTSDLIEFKLNSITSSGGDAFKELIESINKDISIAILGQANTSDLPDSGGSRAALQVQKLVSADIFYSDMRRFENFMEKVLLLDFQYNINRNASQKDVPYSFGFRLSEEQDIEQNAMAIRTIKEAGIPLLKKEVYQRIGFSAPETGEEVF